MMSDLELVYAARASFLEGQWARIEEALREESLFYPFD
jgi:hypothetical protein